MKTEMTPESLAEIKRSSEDRDLVFDHIARLCRDIHKLRKYGDSTDLAFSYLRLYLARDRDWTRKVFNELPTEYWDVAEELGLRMQPVSAYEHH